MEALNEAPAASAFTPLSEHQAQTPTTFFGAKAVLYHHSPGAQLVLPENQLSSIPGLSESRAAIGGAEEAAKLNGDSNPAESMHPATIDGVDVWVTSDKLLLWFTNANKGASIPYPKIDFHAIGPALLPAGSSTTEAQGLVMQISLADIQNTNASFEDIETLELSILPSATATASDSVDGASATTPVQALYDAISACADLHPDPVEQDDEGDDDILDGEDTAPGAGGWITSDNLHEMVDEQGNFIGMPNQSLGAGAGTVRSRADDEEQYEDTEGADQEAEAADGETKWRRTE